MNQVSETENPIEQLARLMEQFKLEEGELGRNGVKVRFARKRKALAQAAPFSNAAAEVEGTELEEEEEQSNRPQEPVHLGTPVNSPMTGIFYSSSGPDSPPYVSVGKHFEAGEVIGLIEAMKVFNEITATEAGTVTKIVAESSKVINADDPILYYKPE